MTDALTRCTLCPRACGVNRYEARGYCGRGTSVTVVRADLHLWEEPCLVGTHGSGTVFFTGCTLGCVYCQNAEISRRSACEGVTLDEKSLARVFLTLQDMGASNINLVTGTPYLFQIISAVRMAKREGLSIPIVYNTSGYETEEAIALLSGTVDIYLADLKSLSPARSLRYMHAKDYPRVARAAISAMVRQVGAPVFDTDGALLGGVIVRHLVLPDGIRDAMHVLSHLAAYGESLIVSLMSQYTPHGDLSGHPALMARVSDRDYRALVRRAEALDIPYLYTQAGESARDSFIPDFGEGGRGAALRSVIAEGNA